MQKVIEALESRIAPAALFTYTEADGDHVTIKTSAKISDADFETYLQENSSFDIEDGSFSFGLTDPVFRKTDLTITVEQAGTGDGKAAIGHIEANVDLRNVSISGDLRSIQAGDSNPGTAAVNKLQVENLGGSGSESYFRGDVKAVKILGDLTGDLYTEGSNFNSINIAGSIKVSGTSVPEISARRIGSLVIGGDMEGEIEAGIIKAIRIGGDIVGGDTGNTEFEEFGEYSGTIYADVIKSVRITGSILGGNDYESGGIYADHLGTVIVGGDVRGGEGEDSGFIWGDESLGKVIVLGSVIGGSGYDSGQVGGYADIGYVYVGQNLVGGSGEDSGWIGSDEGGSIERVVIGGSIIGNGYESGRVDASLIGSVRVGGDLVGGASERSGGISAYGIGSAYIGGNIVGGSGTYSGNVDAGGIGSIRVVGNLTGAAGFGSGSIFGYFGIESVKIGGNVTGDASGSGSVGAVEGSIESITIGGSLTNSGNGLTGIYAGGFIGRVSITGDAIGDEYGTLGIRAGAAYSSVLSIGSVNIKGNATNLLIEAGVGTEISYGDSFVPEIVTTGVTAGATIGAVTIGGNFTTSSIVASVNAGDDGFYGTADDILPLGAPGVVSRIGSVSIGGSVAGTTAVLDTPSAVDGYGIIAQHIVSAKVGGAKQTLATGASTDLVAKFLGATGDVRLIEVPAFLLP